MEIRRLGNTGMRVSALGLGTLTWGRDTLESEAAAQLEAFVEAGGNLVDTSPTYGDGQAEQVLGRMLGHSSSSAMDAANAALSAVTREDLVIVSKAGVSRRHDESFVDASRHNLLSSLDRTLANLGTDYVDLWLIQVPDPHTDFDLVLGALWSAWSTGKARFVGLSNHAGWQCAYAAARLREGTVNVPGLAAVENEYSLLNRQAEAEVLPAAQSLGFGFLGWSALGRGVLTGKYRNSVPPDSRAASLHLQGFVQPYLQGRYRSIVESVATAAQGLEVSPLAVSLAWALQKPGVSSAIVGARSAEQFHQILGALGTKVPRQVMTALDEVSDPRLPVA